MQEAEQEYDRKVKECDRKVKEAERRLEADRATLEAELHHSLLESTDASFERGRQAMASLYSEAAHEFDGGKGVFLPDWEVLLRWVNVLEQRKANEHARQKEKLREEVLRSRGAPLADRPHSPSYIPADIPGEGADYEQAEDEVAGEEVDS
jgi:hypothetical protein